jgi:FkbM family methyltransferase
MINSIQNILQKLNFQLKRYPDSDIRRRLKIIQSQSINTILDIGANTGQYGIYMRKYRYDQKIISFEPLSQAFKGLQSAALKDEKWEVYNYALGNEDSHATINVANNSSSSSILEMLPLHLKNAPHSKYIAQEAIEIKKLDSIFHSLYKKGDRVMLKIDTQGFEKQVIDGAKEALENVLIIQLEMSIVPLYKNEMLFVDMINYLNQIGFKLYSLENGFSDAKNGRLLQVDGVFVKKIVNI